MFVGKGTPSVVHPSICIREGERLNAWICLPCKKWNLIIYIRPFYRIFVLKRQLLGVETQKDNPLSIAVTDFSIARFQNKTCAKRFVTVKVLHVRNLLRIWVLWNECWKQGKLYDLSWLNDKDHKFVVGSDNQEQRIKSILGLQLG